MFTKSLATRTIDTENKYMSIKKCFVDFETYYDKDLSASKQGPRNYMRQTDIYMVAVIIVTDGKEICRYVGHPMSFDWSLVAKDTPGQYVLWVAHNMSFDYWGLKFTIEKWSKTSNHIGASYIVPDEYNCTLNLCASLFNIRSLKECAYKLLGKEVSKEIRDGMKGKHYEDLNNIYKALLQEYCMQDTQLCMEIWENFEHRFGPTKDVDTGETLSERRLSEFTIRSQSEGVAIDIDKLETMKASVSNVLREMRKTIPWANEDDETGKGTKSPKKLEHFCETEGIGKPINPETGKITTKVDSEAYINWLDKYEAGRPAITALRRFTNVSLVRSKIQSIENLVSWDKQEGEYILSYPISFCGTHTRRWSAGKADSEKGKLNIQALDKERLKENPSVYTRELIKARDGHILILADLSQIEPRVLAEICGNDKLLDIVRSGINIYQAFAELCLGYNRANGKLKEYSLKDYTLSKNMLIGLGYKMKSAARFVQYCSVSGFKIDILKAQEAINLYELKNPEVKQFWYERKMDIERALAKDKRLTIDLPSGNQLIYNDIVRERDLKRNMWITKAKSRLTDRYMPIYDGLLTENIVQSIARDIFCERVLIMLDNGYRVLFTSHDEVIIEIKDRGEEDVKRHCTEVERLMAIPPKWMPNIPIGSEVQASKHYTK